MTFERIVLLLFLIIGLGFLIFTIWNHKTLQQLSRDRRKQDYQLNDSKYFELKYKYEFLVAVFSLVITVVTFLGYSSYQSLRENVKADFEAKLKTTTDKIDIQKDSLNSLATELNNQSSKAIQTKDLIGFLEQQQRQLKEKINKNKQSVFDYEVSIKELNRQITTLQNKNIIKQELYIVKDLIYPSSDNWQAEYFEFKKMKTVDNQLLPEFKEPPIIIPFSNNGIIYTVSEVTSKSFYIAATGNGGRTGELPKVYPFSLFISVITKQ